MQVKKKILLVVATVLLLIGGFFIYYINDYYRAQQTALNIVDEMREEDGNLYFDGTTTTGFIIYPGGKVDERAYAALAKELHQNGDTVVIVEVLFHLSILDNNVAKSVIENNPQIENWYLIGHSLGGTSASIFASENPELISGIIFLGSYTYKDLRNYSFACLIITGSNDKVLNHEKALAAEEWYPSNTKWSVIEGGNHAYYGDYGNQAGDGVAAISPQQQQRETVDIILNWINQE